MHSFLIIITEFRPVIISIFMIFFGSSARFSLDVLKGNNLTKKTFMLRMVVSFFSGVTILLASSQYRISSEYIECICGMAGWVGEALLILIENKFLATLNTIRMIDNSKG